METALVVADELVPVVLFANQDDMNVLLKKIEDQALSFVPVLDTAEGRAEIASVAHKVARSKTLLDGLGKELIVDWKAKSKKVDVVRKHTRDFLADLKVRVRQPLTDWETAEAEKKERERLEKEFAEAWESGHAEHDLFLRQKEVERKEAELIRHEAEKAAKAQAEREKQERINREKRIAAEAAEKAKKEAEAAAEKARLDAVEKVRLEKEAAEKREQDLKQAAERAEINRIAAIERGKIEKELAIQEEKRKAQEESDRLEKERQDRKAAEKAERNRIAADKSHRKEINNAALACFDLNGIDSTTAKFIIKLIAQGKIDYITINY